MRKRSLMSFMLGAFAFGMLGVSGSALSFETFRALEPAQQRPAPAFTLPDHNGTPIGSADLKGKITVVRFWATW